MRRLIGCLAVLVGAALAAPAEARETDEIRRSGQLIICANPDALPVSARGEPRGFQLEIAEELAKRLGVRPVPEWIWAGYQARYTDCDLMLGIARDPRPGGHQHFLQALSDVQVVLALRSGDAPADAEALKGRKIAVQSASLAHFRLLDLGAEPRVAYRSQEAILDAVADEKIFAGVVSNLTFAWYRLRHPEADLAAVESGLLGIPDSYPMTIGLRGADSLSRADFEELLEAMRADGTLTRILDTYGQTLSERFDDPYAGLDETVRPPRATEVRPDLIKKVEELARQPKKDKASGTD